MPFVVLFFFFIAFSCWGSFLNVLAYRLIQGTSFLYSRSMCPSCNHVLAWHDLIPIISWFLLRGNCRTCKAPISVLYPFIELFTACSLTLLILITPPLYFVPYFIFFSALLVTIRTDLEFMLISRFTTLYLIPCAFIAAWLNYLPITLYESILGAIGGYLFLYCVSTLFWFITHKQGMGEGDFDLLACIGAFIGPFGCWTTLLIGSILGSAVGIAYLLLYKPTEPLKIPFGPFLALGAMIHVIMAFLHIQLM